MFVPESIPAWNVEEGAGDSATGLVSLGAVMVPEPPDPLVEPEPPAGLEPEPLDGGELGLAEEETAGPVGRRG
jgi:hypothetical protein